MITQDKEIKLPFETPVAHMFVKSDDLLEGKKTFKGFIRVSDPVRHELPFGSAVSFGMIQMDDDKVKTIKDCRKRLTEIDDDPVDFQMTVDILIELAATLLLDGDVCNDCVANLMSNEQSVSGG